MEQIRLFTPPEQTAVLLECVTNLTANELFEGDGECEERILEGIGSLAAQCSLLVVVTGQVDQDDGDYDEGTRSYMRLLGRVNCRLAAMADQVVETVAGIPVILKQNKKGGLPV